MRYSIRVQPVNILLGWSLHDDHICIKAHAISGAGTSSLGQNRTKMRLPRERPLCTFHVSHVSIYVSFWRRCMFVCSENKYWWILRKCCGGNLYVTEWYINWMNTLMCRCKLTQYLCTSEEQEYHVRLPSKRNEHWLHLWDFSGPLAGSRQLMPGAKPHNGDREDALYKLPTATSFWKTRYWLDPLRLLNRFLLSRK